MEDNNNMIHRDLGCALTSLDAPFNNTPQELSASFEILQPIDVPLFANINIDSTSTSNLTVLGSTQASRHRSVLISVLLIAVSIRKLVQRYRHKQRSDHIFPASTNLPPCVEPSHPIFGHMPQASSPPDSAEFNSIFKDHANSSGLSTFWFLNKRCVSVLKAEHAKIVLRNSIERPGCKIITRHFKRSLGQDSLVFMDCGESTKGKWRAHRNLIRTAFTKKAVDSMTNKVWEVANSFTSSLLRKCAKNEEVGSYTAEAGDIFKWVTLDIFGKVAFNYDFRCTDTLTTTPMAHSLNFTVEDSQIRCKPLNLLKPTYQLYWLPTRRNRDFAYHSKNVKDIMSKLCQQREEEIASGMVSDDLLTTLLKSKLESQGVKQKQNPDDTNDGLVKMLLTLFFAGYDTSSILLSMAMYSVATNPEIQRECAAEARDVNDALEEDASQWESRLAYCRAVIMETLRLHPPVVSNCRMYDLDLKLDGCTIPKWTRVYLPTTQIQTDERNFARPKEFLPERWVRRDGTNSNRWVARDHTAEPKNADNNSTYIPPANPQFIFAFSGGARNCVGHRLALQESTMVFACLLRDLTVNVREGFVMQKRKKFALSLPAEMPLIFTRRQQQI